MAAIGTQTLVWRGGEDQFCLSKVGDILALEEKCKASIAVIAGRLEGGFYGLNDVRETIRLGLIGGGATPVDAMEKVHRFVDGHDLAHSVLVANEIVKAVIFGTPEDDPVGKKAMPAEAKPTGSSTKTDASDDPKSSPSEQPLAGPLA